MSSGDAEAKSERIRQRAYALWESEGRPDGRDREHWDRAQQEEGAEPAAPKRKVGRPRKDAGAAAPAKPAKTPTARKPRAQKAKSAAIPTEAPAPAKPDVAKSAAAKSAE